MSPSYPVESLVSMFLMSGGIGLLFGLALDIANRIRRGAFATIFTRRLSIAQMGIYASGEPTMMRNMDMPSAAIVSTNFVWPILLMIAVMLLLSDEAVADRSRRSFRIALFLALSAVVMHHIAVLSLSNFSITANFFLLPSAMFVCSSILSIYSTYEASCPSRPEQLMQSTSDGLKPGR